MPNHHALADLFLAIALNQKNYRSDCFCCNFWEVFGLRSGDVCVVESVKNLLNYSTTR